MKILVIGKNSYIAKEFVHMISQSRNWEIHFLSVRDNLWRTFDYSSFDSILYFAAIVHHPEIMDESLYQHINVEIPHDIAVKAKEVGVKQFVYISTCAVWGIGPLYGQLNVINTLTPLEPKSLYGKSKLNGEKQLEILDDAIFHVARVRFPNVYGKDCPGTFYHRIEGLSRLQILPVDRHNKLFSLISVENVSKSLCIIIENNLHGVICPQDPIILSIAERISLLAQQRGKRQIQTKIFWPLFWCINKIAPNKYLNNLYGGYYIDSNYYPVIVDKE